LGKKEEGREKEERKKREERGRRNRNGGGNELESWAAILVSWSFWSLLRGDV
jgi:hypothetical protein